MNVRTREGDDPITTILYVPVLSGLVESSVGRKWNISGALWLTIDEKSVLMTPLLALLSQAASIVRAGLNPVNASTPFSRLNIILLGDFHQFPPDILKCY